MLVETLWTNIPIANCFLCTTMSHYKHCQSSCKPFVSPWKTNSGSFFDIPAEKTTFPPKKDYLNIFNKMSTKKRRRKGDLMTLDFDPFLQLSCFRRGKTKNKMKVVFLAHGGQNSISCSLLLNWPLLKNGVLLQLP